MSDLINKLQELGQMAPDERARGMVANILANCSYAATALTEQAAEIDRLREEMRQIRGMARHGCDAPNAAYRWCERIDEVILHGAQGEYAEYSMPLPARAALNKEPTQ